MNKKEHKKLFRKNKVSPQFLIPLIYQPFTEARRLANQLAAKREQDRRFAEQRLHELEGMEKDLKIKVRELGNNQAQEVHELEVKVDI